MKRITNTLRFGHNFQLPSMHFWCKNENVHTSISWRCPLQSDRYTQICVTFCWLIKLGPFQRYQWATVTKISWNGKTHLPRKHLFFFLQKNARAEKSNCFAFQLFFFFYWYSKSSTWHLAVIFCKIVHETSLDINAISILRSKVWTWSWLECTTAGQSRVTGFLKRETSCF